MTLLDNKDPITRIKSRSCSKTNIFRLNRSERSDQNRNLKADGLKLMNPTLLSLEGLMGLINQKEDYIWIPCLSGARHTLVVSSDRKTETLHPPLSFRSMLPNGSYAAKDSSGCILDVLWKDNVFWVLDILIWKDCQLLDCDADFRSYWINSSLNCEMAKVALANEYAFLPRPRIDGKDQNWKKVIQEWCNNMDFDGLLAYHKNSYYLPGQTSSLVYKISKEYTDHI